MYELTDQFPKSELYGLTSQLRRAAISIQSNIAEGKARGTKRDYRHFLTNAFGSGAEVETQIEVAKMLPFWKNLDYSKIDALLQEVMSMLNVLIRKLF